MPSYKLNSAVRIDIMNSCDQLLKRRLDHVRADFPLDVDRIQQCIMPERAYGAVQELIASGFHGLPSMRAVTVGLWRNDFALTSAPLLRSAAVLIAVPRDIYVLERKYSSWSGRQFFPDNRVEARVHTLHGLTEDEKQALARWTNAVVYERRMGELAAWAVTQALHCCVNTGHILASWPLLTTLIQDPYWRIRFRSPPLQLQRIHALPSDVARLERPMAAAAIILSGAQLMGEYVAEPGAVRANVEAWERLPTDKRYNNENTR